MKHHWIKKEKLPHIPEVYCSATRDLHETMMEYWRVNNYSTGNRIIDWWWSISQRHELETAYAKINLQNYQVRAIPPSTDSESPNLAKLIIRERRFRFRKVLKYQYYGNVFTKCDKSILDELTKMRENVRTQIAERRKYLANWSS